jgi:hypothetical protein
MKILFIHQNFPGQFKHLAPALVAQGHEVHALKLTRQPPTLWQGVRVHSYQPQRGSTPHIHPWVMDLETKVIRAEAVMRWATQQRDEFGFTPDVVLAHPQALAQCQGWLTQHLPNAERRAVSSNAEVMLASAWICATVCTADVVCAPMTSLSSARAFCPTSMST